MSSGQETNSEPHLLLKTVVSLPDQGASAEHTAGSAACPTALLTVQVAPEETVPPVSLPVYRAKLLASPDLDHQHTHSCLI